MYNGGMASGLDHFKEIKLSDYEKAQEAYEQLNFLKLVAVNLVSFVAGLLTLTFFYRSVFIWMVNKFYKNRKRAKGANSKDPIQKELEGKIFDIGIKRSNLILQKEAPGSFLIRRAGLGYVFDLTVGPKEFRRVVFDVNEGVIYDERNRKYFTLKSFVDDTGGKTFVIPIEK